MKSCAWSVSVIPLWVGLLFGLFGLAELIHAAEKWPLAADPGVGAPKWQITEGMGIVGPNRTHGGVDTVRPATGTPILLTGNGVGSTSRDVWNLTDFSKIGTLGGRIDTSTNPGAISPDGKVFAVIKKKSFTTSGVEIWSVEDSKKVKTLDIGPSAESVIWSGFVSETRFLALHETGPKQTSMRLTEITAEANAKPAASIPGPSKIEKRLITVSPGGRFLATGTTDGAISVNDLKQKTPAFRLSAPEGLGQLAGVMFSPDGTELGAAFWQAGQANSVLQILAWNLADGQISLQLKNLRLTSIKEAVLSLEWLPDGSALLIGNNTLVDRNSGQVAWRLQLPAAVSDRSPRVFLGTDYLLIPKQDSTSGFEAFKLPWREIDSGVKSLQSKTTAWFRPGDKLSLKVNVSDARFHTAEQVRTALTDSIQKRLAEEQFTIAEGQPVTLQVSYSEAAGNTLHKSEGGFPFPRGPRIPRPPGFSRPGGFPRSSGIRGMANDDERAGTGTAFIIHADGYLLTCAHVVGSAPSVRVKIDDKSYHARVIAKNVPLDFALLKIEVKGLPILPLADSSKIELGEEVRAVGFPISTVLGESLKTTRGTIAGLVKRDGKTLFQVDASINPGNSGGPLVNEKGEVVGINSAKLVHESIDNVGFSIPINEVKALLKEQKVEFLNKGSTNKLAGPELVKRVSPAVVFVISTGGTSPGIPGGADQVVVTQITCDLSLVVNSLPQPVWRERFVIEPNSLVVKGPLSDQKARDIAFGTLQERLAQISLPYFISKDSTPVVLPIISDLNETGLNETRGLEPRKTRRGSGN